MAEDNEPRDATNEEFRMMLQLETSLLGWLRTSLALMGFSFVIARFGLFLREIAIAAQIGVKTHPWLGMANTVAGTGLILLGVVVMRGFLAILVIGFGLYQYYRHLKRREKALALSVSGLKSPVGVAPVESCLNLTGADPGGCAPEVTLQTPPVNR